MYTDKFNLALAWTAETYAKDVRKSSGVPTICHPLGVCSLVIEAGGDEDAAIAALLHDFAEDKGGETILELIKEKFGTNVEQIVRNCSDTIPDDYALKEPWMDRKLKHIIEIPSFDENSCLVLAADTLHNAKNHVQGYRENGIEWWTHFRANVYKDKELTPQICLSSTVWYLMQKCRALSYKLPNCTIIFELKKTIDELVDLISVEHLSGTDEHPEFIKESEN